MRTTNITLKAAIFAAAMSFLAGPAFAQLAGTERLNENHWFIGDRKVQFGNTPNAQIYYSGGNLIVDVISGGGKVSMPDGVDLGGASLSFGSSLIFEGSTADANETTLTVVDPSADRTITLPNQTGAAILSAAGVAETANAISGGTGTLVWEGSSADASETTLGVTNPTADRSVAFPDASGFAVLSPADIEAAGGFWGGASSLVFEGSSADGSETTLSVTNPTADRAVVVPDAGGTMLLGGNVSVAAGADTACSTTCGGATKCVGGFDAGTPTIVDCADATADKCFCSAN